MIPRGMETLAEYSGGRNWSAVKQKQSDSSAPLAQAGELMRRGIRGIFLTLTGNATILEKGFLCREWGRARICPLGLGDSVALPSFFGFF